MKRIIHNNGNLRAKVGWEVINIKTQAEPLKRPREERWPTWRRIRIVANTSALERSNVSMNVSYCPTEGQRLLDFIIRYRHIKQRHTSKLNVITERRRP